VQVVTGPEFYNPLNISYHSIRAIDDYEANVLEYFPQARAFFDEAISKGGKVRTSSVSGSYYCYWILPLLDVFRMFPPTVTDCPVSSKNGPVYGVSYCHTGAGPLPGWGE